MTGFLPLAQRRENRIDRFLIKCTQHPKHSKMFPLNPPAGDYSLKSRPTYKVNFARTEAYRRSPIIFGQKRLNKLAEKSK